MVCIIIWWNKIRKFLLICSGFAFVALFSFLFLFNADLRVNKEKYPKTPYGSMLRDGCDPDHTYYLHTIASENYYVPWAAFHHYAYTSSHRYVDKMYLSFNYPDLSYTKDEPATQQEIQRLLGVMIDDRSKVIDSKEMFEKSVEAIHGKKMPNQHFGFDVFDDPKYINRRPEDQRPTIIYYDREWKDGYSFVNCSRLHQGCTLYVSKGNLSYRISFIDYKYWPEIKTIRDQIISKVEGYKLRPSNKVILPENYGDMMGTYKCRH